MRIAIITDIHGNLPALEAVLSAAEAATVDELWCLGDVVGYGAQPDDCVRLVAERCAVCLAGNHDLAALGVLDYETFSPAAAAAVRWTADNAARETLDFLRGLEPTGASRGIALYHASPRDPVWEYVLSVDQASECMDVQSERISLIGHSHVALYFMKPDSSERSPERTTKMSQRSSGRTTVARERPSERARGGAGEPSEEATGAMAEADLRLDLSENRWLINPGSVGQPRDEDPRAAWLELDTESLTATYRRLEYDIDRAAQAIKDAGLPPHLGDRLYVGR